MDYNYNEKHKDILTTFDMLEDDIDFNMWLSNSKKEGAKYRIQNFKSQLIAFLDEEQ